MTVALRRIHFTLNERPATADIQPSATIVEVLRNQFGLFGTRESCGQGLCGCCTVMVDGIPVSGCLYLAAFADGARIATIESVAQEGVLDPIQEAFIEAGAFQCGYCTSGFILMARQLLRENPSPSEDEIKDYLAGNLCRCGAYPEIITAIKSAASRR